MRIMERDELVARCEASGVERTVSLFLLQHEDLAVGDMVMVHVGYAIQKMSEEEALSAWRLFDEIEAIEEGNARTGDLPESIARSRAGGP